MEDCQSSEKISDNRHNKPCVDTVTIHDEENEVNVELDENVAIEEECEHSSNGNGNVLTDNFLVKLLSRDSTVDSDMPEDKVVLKPVGNTTENANTKVKAFDAIKTNIEVEKEQDNHAQNKDCAYKDLTLRNTISDSATSEQEAEVCKLLEVEIPTEAVVVEVSLAEKEKNKLDCEIHSLETSQTINMLASNVANSFNEKSDVEIIKEVVIKETQKSCGEKEKSVESVSHTFSQSGGYRCESDIWTDDDEDSSTSDSSSSGSDFFQEMCEKSKPKKLPFVKTKGELGLDDLPPIEDLVISVNESEMTSIGKIYAVVEKLVVIRSLKGMKALDLDSVLFLSHDQPLGRVFDVFGPVNEPFYSVRFNSVDQINEKGVKIGAEVFFAPEKRDITTYVFVEELQNQRGSDASWKHNNEPPEEFLDYSDDEKEKNAKRQRRFKNRNRQFTDNPDAPAKRPLMAENASNYIPPPKPAPHWTHSRNISPRFQRRNPFQSHIPPASPSPSVCSVMPPVRMQNSFGSSLNQPQRLAQPQNILYRSSPQFLVSPYQQPHVFGQVTVLNPLSPALHAPSPLPSPVMNNMPTLIPASHFSAPQNYFNQTFSRIPSPGTHNQHMPPDPWLPNRSPNSHNVPPSHPLTVQIPSLSSPSIPMHQFPQERGSMQQFMNIQNANFNEVFVNNNRNFPPANMHPRFYHR